MNPTQRRGKRNVFCSFYSECLDIAIGKGWMHWNCAKCEQRFNKEAEPELPRNVNYHVAYYEVSTE
jgi:tRNA(Ile2) C34 agmatinyltransferase TiaS